jgi:hypothetical protein
VAVAAHSAVEIDKSDVTHVKSLSADQKLVEWALSALDTKFDQERFD